MVRQSRGWRRARAQLVAGVVIVACAPGSPLWASDALLARAASGPAPAAPDTIEYRFPSGRDRLLTWAWNAAGPPSLGGNLVGASWRQWVTDEPPEWGSGRDGFAKRFGAGCMTTAIGETSLSLASALMRQDPGYYRSPREGVRKRAWHAVAMTFLARSPTGDAVFSPAKTLSPLVGPLVTQMTVYPDRYDFGSALTSGLYGLLITAGWNTAREFIVPTPSWGGGRAPGSGAPEDPRAR